MLPHLLVPCEDQLQASGRPVFDEAGLNEGGILRWKRRGIVAGREILDFIKVGRRLCPALSSAVEMIVDQEKGRGVRQVGIPAGLILGGFDPALVVQLENPVNGKEMEMLPYLVPAHRVTQMISDLGLKVSEEVPSISLMAYRKVFRDPLRKPRWKAPEAGGHPSMNEFMDEEPFVRFG